MSEFSTMSQEEARAVLGAYALGALSQTERAAVEGQLQASAELRAELAEHQRALSRLVQAEPQLVLPAGIKTKLLSRIGATSTASPIKLKQPGLLSRVWQQAAHGIAVPRLGLLAATLVVALGLGGLGYRVVQLSNQSAAQRAALALLSDTTAVSVKLNGRPAAPNATGRIRYKPNSNVGILETWSLPPLEANRIYQLWLVYPDNTRDTGAIFKIVSAEGTTTVVVMAPKPFGMYTNFGISIEPDGGSPGPTGPGVLSTRS